MKKSNLIAPSISEIAKTVVDVRRSSLEEGVGGPFGAFVFDSDGKVVGRGTNRVIEDCDPTAHAEITAIRAACAALKTHDLSGYNLYATGYPCPMCLSAIIWANIKNVWYSSGLEAAKAIGFRDDFIYDFIRGGCSDSSIMDIKQIPYPEMDEIYVKYSRIGKNY